MFLQDKLLQDIEQDTVEQAAQPQVVTKKLSSLSAKMKSRRGSYDPSWLLKKDENGVSFKSFLRPVTGNVHGVFCSADCTTLNVQSRGFTAVQDHIKSRMHIKAMERNKKEGSVATYSQKYTADSDTVARSAMKLLLYSKQHYVALQNLPCLVQLCKAAFPDSQIAQSLKPMQPTSGTYHLRSMAKTELERLKEDMSGIMFSAAMMQGQRAIKRELRF